MSRTSFYFFFFFNDTATTEIYTLSLHDALPISDVNGEQQEGFGRIDRTTRNGRRWSAARGYLRPALSRPGLVVQTEALVDRKSTRLNSSHLVISYAVFCLKKKKKKKNRD